MATIAPFPDSHLRTDLSQIASASVEAPQGADPWPEIVRRAREALSGIGVAERDAIVLLPFAQLLPLARRAFGAAGGWLPRIETTQTLAESLGPRAAVEAGQVSFDTTVDLLSAAQLMRSQAWGDAWARRDARGFERATRTVVATAHALLRGAAAVPPATRDAHWSAARDLLPPLAGPGATERVLARVALEWAALAAAPPTDRLFDLRPGAWVVVRAGGPDPMVDRLVAESPEVPCTYISTDAAESDPFGLRELDAEAPQFALCDGFEEEAQCAASQVVEYLRGGRAPVVLIAQDRVLVRRVRALLERGGTVMLDETGWKLSTTRAAALVMSLLKAARPDAPADAVLDWLKALPDRGDAFAATVDAFEARLRRRQLARVDAIAKVFAAEPDDSASGAMWSRAAALLGRLRGPARQPLPDWIAALRDALIACEAWSTMQRDDAGRQVLDALRFDGAAVSTSAPAPAPASASASASASTSAWRMASSGVTMSLAGFTDWVDSVLEQASFMPIADPSLVPQVVVTPLARAMLRPFGAAVFPGADDRHLGAAAPIQDLLSDEQAGALGVVDAAGRRRAELLAFGQLMRIRRLTMLRRRVDGAEPLAESPLLARLALALGRRGSRLEPWLDPRIDRSLEPTPIVSTAPRGDGLLPERLSASACEALRACPYRFFALNMLRLGEEEELDGEVEKRDYGTWLHAVLFAFHAVRSQPATSENEVASLLAFAESSREELGIAEQDFLPFAASFASFAPRYVAWLHERDAAGWSWSRGEAEFVTEPEGFGGIALRGIIDRIDVARAAGEQVTELIDYKTGSASSLKEKVREPLEDTQLAFYAALMPQGVPLKAIYLALDGSKAIEVVEHPDVADSAEALLDGLAGDLARIRGGAGLPALGVGDACEYCAARGICRRDHWSASEGTA